MKNISRIADNILKQAEYYLGFPEVSEAEGKELFRGWNSIDSNIRVILESIKGHHILSKDDLLEALKRVQDAFNKLKPIHKKILTVG